MGLDTVAAKQMSIGALTEIGHGDVVVAACAFHQTLLLLFISVSIILFHIILNIHPIRRARFCIQLGDFAHFFHQGALSGSPALLNDLADTKGCDKKKELTIKSRDKKSMRRTVHVASFQYNGHGRVSFQASRTFIYRYLRGDS